LILNPIHIISTQMQLGDLPSSDPKPSEVTVRKPTVPLEVRALLGPSWIINGEDPQVYEALLAQVGAAVGAKDIVDWLLIKDFVALTWDIQRSRRIRDGLMRDARSRVVFDVLRFAMRNETPRQRNAIAKLHDRWRRGEETARQSVAELLAERGMSDADISARAFEKIAQELDMIDQQNERREHRRDRLLQEIERRRHGWGKQVKSVSEEIVDATYTHLPGSTLPRGRQ
jgi:hypothetical protein